MIRLGLVLLHRDSMGTIVRVRELANSLASIGFEVFLISSFDTRNMGFVRVHPVRIVSHIGRVVYSSFGSSLKQAMLHSKIAGSLALRPEVIRKGIGFLARDLVKVASKLRLDVLEGNQDIAAAAAVTAGDSLGIPVVAGLHGIWREELLGVGRLDRKADEFLHELLTWTLDHADLITVVSEAMKERFVSYYGGRPEKLLVIPLGCRPKRDSVPHPDDKPPKVVHSGQISFYDNESLLFRTAVEFKKRSGRPFYLAKKGDGVQHFEKQALKIGVDLDWYWFEDAARFYDFLCGCRIGVVTNLDHATRHYGPAMKFYDYLSCGIPVVANKIGGWTDEIERYGVGILAHSEPESMTDAILDLASDGEKAYAAGQRALALAKSTYNMETIASEAASRYLML